MNGDDEKRSGLIADGDDEKRSALIADGDDGKRSALIADGARAGVEHPAEHGPGAAGRDRAQRATFAAGCFWGVEAALRAIDGVLATCAGYTGGHTLNPTYEQVCSHSTGHAEAVEVWFDPELVSYEQLLDAFWTLHNPTLLTTAGWDLGDQYRSAIFVHDGEQAALAEASRERAQARFEKPIVTEITPAPAFYPAEARHQQYFERRGRTHTPARAQTVR